MGFDRAKELTPRVEPLFPLFAAAMNLVLIADDAYAFLFSWELMSLASWALVVARHTDAESRRAGASLSGHGGDRHGGAAVRLRRPRRPGRRLCLRHHRAAIRPSRWSPPWCWRPRSIGCGSKGGLVPLHAWLPLAHPAAPSHVSALMSGVMTKVAIYGFVRIAFDLLGPPAWWWALPPIILGALTAVLGLLYAVLDRDLKRVLAYSTIENVGVIFVALGLALAFRANGQHAGSRGRHGRGAAACAQSFLVQVAAVPRRRRRAARHRAARSRWAGRPHPPHAAHRRLLPGRRARHLRLAAAQRLRLGVAAVPGGHRGAGAAAGGRCASPRRRSAPCWRWPRRSRPPASCASTARRFSAGRAAPRRRRRTTCRSPSRSRWAGSPACASWAAFSAACWPRRSAPVLGDLVGGGAAGRAAGPTPFSLVAFDPARSIYDAPVIALFVAIASLTTAGRRPSPVGAPHAPRTGVGLRLSRSVAGHAVHRLELRPAAAPRLRRRGLCARRRRS